ncbi:VanW family protein [Aquibacillus sediminis]|uniref:VanW family protein n=1 Tax=Aquibacillus sediminis TaxID=2574734 RepID=UPI001108DB07|nr:VanW family protein [Aquibacillus sediminis]
MKWDLLQSQKLKPKVRSNLRVYLGANYYCLKRRAQWYTDGKHYASTIDRNSYPYQIKQHKTPLRRQLKDVEMGYQENKIVNLQLALKQLDGIIIQPGETFSYWKRVGRPTKRKGYKKGMVLHYGTFKAGTGGGLCQLSNLIYWITLHTPLTVTERHRHSYDVFPDVNRTQPFGSGATCVYNYLDLQILNQTENTYQLCLNLTDHHLVGQWRSLHPETMSYQIYEKDHKITYEHWGYYVRHNVIHRKVFNGRKQQIDDQYVTENHALMMYNPLLEYGDDNTIQ